MKMKEPMKKTESRIATNLTQKPILSRFIIMADYPPESKRRPDCISAEPRFGEPGSQPRGSPRPSPSGTGAERNHYETWAGCTGLPSPERYGKRYEKKIR